MNTQSNKKKNKLLLTELVLFAMLGSLMFVTRVVMAVLPNIHLLGMFIMVFTLVFRVKALIPLYVYVFIEGVFAGFDIWWMPYLYIWTILWGITMLLPKRMPKMVACIVYPIVCGLHGLLFGVLYAPAQAVFFGYTFDQMLVWIANGALFDILHGIGDFCAGLLIVPLTELLKKLVTRTAK